MIIGHTHTAGKENDSWILSHRLGGAVELVEQVVQQQEAALRRPNIDLIPVGPQDGVPQQCGKPGASGVG
ncbi:hypothetical protein, partial [Mycolicibacterium fortuitum]|uniref:hypothetical protein n=1 Tax=Mycolicibacterium fortuitum TaxID=1766 RepID=UPI00241DE292